ncbi:hypothetical protein CLAFUW4_13706 [Fulvia fulva]|nr:hypothetical protein CLAFUR4_13709 [Fulvia fulva]KAK4611073.1 hypothetical protein CLAFUR0_13713 [Fulvia fulva]WPV21811.1 hypothetical protein CLAFUW4_13706 [Fulvia fulva]WPV36859.1 hypothetical protein CLAFUW7_13714 [Fulvia fulva]
MATIAGVAGVQFQKGSQFWENDKYQYASSAHGMDHDMNPALIVQATNKEDIKATLSASDMKVLQASKQEDVDLVERATGQLLTKDDRRDFVFTSVSHSLMEFNTFLGKNKLFVPHGQCSHVHLGGHVHTGGYGQLGRSFGLFGDHVWAFWTINADSQEVFVTKGSDPELFWATLGGSPGNFGVTTHVLLEVHRDAHYKGSLGLKAMHLYNKKSVARLVGMVAEMSDNPDFPRNYDLCVSVLSGSFPLCALWPGLDSEIKEEQPSIFGEDNMLGWPRIIVVYAQWVPFSPTDKPDMTWFSRLQDGAIRLFQEGTLQKPMSELTPMWLFRDVREFDLPYVKRTYLTKSTPLQKDNWVPWITSRIDEIVAPLDNYLWLSCQIQAFGGKNSMFTRNADNGTSYSWRDSTMCCTIDAFHCSGHKQAAEDWQAENDQVGVGPGGIFSRQDRRVLWGSYGRREGEDGFDLDSVWERYYDDRGKYERLMRARAKANPYGTFTPNSFCVKRAA